MKKETGDNVDRRLARIEGQVKALRRMVGEDRYCIDVARQVQAARAALSSLESIIGSHQKALQRILDQGTPERRLNAELTAVEEPLKLPDKSAGLNFTLKILIPKTLVMNPQMSCGGWQTCHQTDSL